MAEITRQRISELLRVAFDLLWFEPDGLYLHEILDYVGTQHALTEEERGSFSFAPRFPRYEAVIRIASIPLVRAGWLTKSSKGKWQITDKGRRESKQFSNAEDFFNTAIDGYERWKDQEAARKEVFDPLVIERAEERAWEQIQAYIQAMSAPELRSLVGDLLRGLGYFVIWTAPADGADGQVHLIARSNPLGVNGGRILVHVNHGEQAATSENLHAFMSVLAASDYGLYVSPAGFSARAGPDVYLGPQANLRLVALDEFIELWLRTEEKLSPEARNRLPLRPVYFLLPPEI